MTTVRIDRKGDLAFVIIKNPPVNATSTAVRKGLMKAIDAVQSARLAFLLCEGKTFIAGGDMSEFDRPAEEPHLPDVVNAIEASKTPFIALMHGTVLGGGFEIAMACAARIAASGTKFGLPEVKVGLIPGAGGTQRAPRLLGWELAIRLACKGEFVSAEELLEIGAIDAIEPDLLEAARKYIFSETSPVSARTVEPASQQDWDSLKKDVSASAKGHLAPLLNLEALKWANEPFTIGQPKERKLHLELRQSDESRALRSIFFAERLVAKPSFIKGAATKEIEKVAIVGGGLMGAGVAAACLINNLTVRLIERDDKAASDAYSKVQSLLEGAVKRGKLSSSNCEEALQRFEIGSSYELAKNVDLALEAVFENLDAKRNVFASLDAVVSPNTILATNTSYLDPIEIFEGISHSERCLGIHFFSPAHIMKLVEVIHTPHSDADLIASAFGFARRLKKLPVLSGICDGFIGNRILAAYRRKAEYLLADGALPHEIDAAMRAFGMAMGPFEAQDMSGLQIAEANRRRHDKSRDSNERYVTISDTLCAQARYGIRSGRGWYAYNEGSKKPQIDAEVEAVIHAYSQEKEIKRRCFSQEEIQSALLSVMANEGAKIVEEGIVESDASIDVVKIHGYGFPRRQGGPMHWAMSRTRDEIKNTLGDVVKASPNSWILAERFQ